MHGLVHGCMGGGDVNDMFRGVCVLYYLDWGCWEWEDPGPCHWDDLGMVMRSFTGYPYIKHIMNSDY